MIINKIKFNKIKNADVKIINAAKNFFLKNKIRIYILVTSIFIYKIIASIAYLNIIIATQSGIINSVIAPLIAAIIFNFKSKILLIFSVILIFPLMSFTLIGKISYAEQLANFIYGLIVIGVLIMFINFIKEEYDFKNNN